MAEPNDGTLYVNGKAIGKVHGLSIISEAVARHRRDSWPARLDDCFGPTNPTLESLLPPEGR